MNPELHAFFLDPSASGHFLHAELSQAYRRAYEQAGGQHELMAYADDFDFLLEEAREYLDDEAEHHLYPEYVANLADLLAALRAMGRRAAQVSDLQIEIRQSLEEIEDLRIRYGEGLLAGDDPAYDSWLDARQRSLSEVERLRADPDMAPHLDRVLTNLPELANAATPATLAEAAAAASSPPAPDENAAIAPAANAGLQSEGDAATVQVPGNDRPLIWAGIGSRQTPAATLAEMTGLAGRMADAGWHLASGGADGADTAFAAGAPADQRTVWLPWPGYNDLSGPDCLVPTPDRLRKCLAIAERLHPAWDRCSAGARKLHARNVAILLGPNLDRPVDAVVCWTENGAVTGGTGMGLLIAAEHGIPIFNLGSMTMKEAWDKLQALQRSLRPENAVQSAATSMSAGALDLKEGMARVLHLRDAPPDAIRIDRRTRWGNPFVIGRDGTREEVIEKYRDHLWGQIRTGKLSLDDLAGLHGKDLACHCAPQPCHGDVLSRAAAWANANRNRTATRPAAQHETRTYDPGEACVFRFSRDEWGVFSNFYPSIQAIGAAGQTFKTSEHLYQAAKFRGSPDVQAGIAGASSAKDAATIGRDTANAPDADWNARRVDAMRWVIRMKREANPELVDAALHKTGDRPIVEFSRNDSFWGAQPQGDSLVGRNVLGTLWMELRQHIRDGDPRALASAWEDPLTPKTVARAPAAHAAEADLPASPGLTTRRQFLEATANHWADAHENPAAAAETWQTIKTDYASLYAASGDRINHLPYQEGFAGFRDLVAGAVRDGACPPGHRDRLNALHETLETQGSRHDTVSNAAGRLDDVLSRLDGLKEKADAEQGHTIETMPGYTAWLRDRDEAVAHWRELAQDPAHKEHMLIAAPDMMAARIAELSNRPLNSIHQPCADTPVPSPGQDVYTPSLQPLSQVYDRAMAFVDRDPNLLPYAPQFDELKAAISTALDECSHTPDLVTKLTTLRTTLDESQEHKNRAQALAENVSRATHDLCSMKTWAAHAGKPVHEAPRFKTWREEADRALHDYEAAKTDPALAVHLARADSLGVLTETAVPMLRDPRFREPVAAESSLVASRQRSEQAEEHYSMSA